MPDESDANAPDKRTGVRPERSSAIKELASAAKEAVKALGGIGRILAEKVDPRAAPQLLFDILIALLLSVFAFTSVFGDIPEITYYLGLGLMGGSILLLYLFGILR